MLEKLLLDVWRIEPELSDGSPREYETHSMRRDTLHEVLDNMDGVKVQSWGGTSDAGPHEVVEVIVEVAGLVITTAAIPVLIYLGQELVKNALSTVASEAVKGLIARLKPKQDAKQINDFHIRLPNNFVVISYPAGLAAEKAILRVVAPDGKVTDIPFDATAKEIAQLTQKVT